MGNLLRRAGSRIREAWEVLRGHSDEFTLAGSEAVDALSKLKGSGLSKLWRWATAPLRSADREIKGSLRALRAKARELVWTWSYGSRWANLLVENVVGDTGFQLQATNERADGSRDQKVNRELEKGWKRWGRPGVATADGKLSWHGVEKLLLRTWAQDGEMLLRLYRGFDNGWGFAVEVLDPDQLDEKLNRPATDSQNQIRMGVEVDEWGRPLFYHIWRRHPEGIRGSNLNPPERQRVPAEDVIHVFDPWRAGQTRGLPPLTPVLFDSEMLSGLEEAELTASRIAAAKMGFFQTNPEYQIDPEVISGESQATLEIEVAPGSFVEVPAGYEFQAFDPTHPTSAFGDFHKSILRSIASGMHTSYNPLANDLEGVNFSSLRQAALIERVTFRMIQRWVWEHVHDRVYQAWLSQALLAGQLELQSFRARDFDAHEWRPRGWEWVDPVKEVQAEVIAIRAGLESRTAAAARRGRDLEQIFKEIQRENELAEEMGLELDTSLEDAPSPGGPDGDDGNGGRRRLGRSGEASRSPFSSDDLVRAARDAVLEALHSDNGGSRE